MAIPQFNELELLHHRMCRAVNDPRRLQILYALAEQPCNVTELAERLDVPQPTVSRHLATLRQSGVVATRREGTGVFYSIAEPRIIDLLDLMRSMLKDMLAKQSNLMDVVEA